MSSPKPPLIDEATAGSLPGLTLHTVEFHGGVTALLDTTGNRADYTQSGWTLPRLANVTSAALTAVWGAPPSISTTSTLTVSLLGDDFRTTLGEATGTSPLQFPVNKSLSGRTAYPMVKHPPAGATVNENVSVTLRIEYFD